MTDAEIIERVRFLLGSVSDSILPDPIIQIIVDYCRVKHPSNDCELIYCVLLDSLLWLIRNSLQNSGSTGGAIEEREEVNGRRKIRIKYGAGAGVNPVIEPWTELYNDFLSHPEYVCEELLEERKNNGAWIHVGGVSKSKSDSIKNNPDSKGSIFGIGWLDDL